MHRARQMAVRNRTAQCNQLHGLLLKYGIEAPRGVKAMPRRLPEVLEDAENELSVAVNDGSVGRGRLSERQKR